MSVSNITVPNTTSAYSNGDSVGGLIQLNSNVFGSNFNRIIESILIHDSDSQDAPLRILFFNQEPDSSTTTDNDEFSLDVADFGKLYSYVDFAADEYMTIGGETIAQKENTIIPSVPKSNSNGIYILVVTMGDVTYSTENGISVNLVLA